MSYSQKEIAWLKVLNERKEKSEQKQERAIARYYARKAVEEEKNGNNEQRKKMKHTEDGPVQMQSRMIDLESGSSFHSVYEQSFTHASLESQIHLSSENGTKVIGIVDTKNACELAKRKRTFSKRNEFACQWPVGNRELNYRNQDIINALERKIEVLNDRVGEIRGTKKQPQEYWRAQKTKMLIQKIKSSGDENMNKWSQVEFREKGFTQNNINVIQEILKNGDCELVRYTHICPSQKIKRQLTKVWGIGPARADDLVKQGITSIDNLKEKLKVDPETVSDRVKRALLHYDDLQTRIPRDEAALIATTVCQAAHVAARRCSPGSKVTAFAAGSFRRGKIDCGDVDILVTCHAWEKIHVQSYNNRAHFLDTILESLGEVNQGGFLAADLVERPCTKRKINFSDGPATYMGICQLPNKKARRLDIKVYHPSQLAFAMLYFSGNDYFNRSMRSFANKCGWSLSDKGIRKRLDDGTDSIGPYITECRSERAIFEQLGLEYREPYERDPTASFVDIEAAHARLVYEAQERRKASELPILPDIYTL